MIVYNITIKINETIHEEWLVWQKEQHIREIMTTGLFEDSKIYRLLDQDDTEGPTYIIQFFADTLENYFSYLSHYAAHFVEMAYKKWGNQFIAFRSLLEAVQ